VAFATPLDWGVNVTLNGTLCPDAIVIGNDCPLSVKLAVLILAELTITFEPVALSDACRLTLVPSTTLPKFKFVGLTASWPAAVPVPESGIVKFEFDAFETKEMLPPALRADCGAKITLNVRVCPGVRVTGGLKSLILKPAPETASFEMVTSERPIFVKASDSVRELPT
jgi:hypothetical protein